MNDAATNLLKKIENRDALVGIIGLGYVGLPLALTFTESGFRVLGFDVDSAKVEKLNRGESYIEHLDPERVKRATGHASTDPPNESQGEPTTIQGRAGEPATSNPQPATPAGRSGEPATPQGRVGESAIRNPQSAIQPGRAGAPNTLLSATSDFNRLGEPDAILICVPTPLTPQRDPDMTYVRRAAHQVKRTLRTGQLIVLESTTYPGTTDELLKPILEGADPRDSRRAEEPATPAGRAEEPAIRNPQSAIQPGRAGETSSWPDEGDTSPGWSPNTARDGRADEPAIRNPQSAIQPGRSGELETQNSKLKTLVCGEDFFLAFSPEREDPGNPSYGTGNIPKVIGGVDPTSGELANALYSAAVERTVPVSSARVAEAAKLVENIFRATNIALVNELKIVFDRMGIDIWEVLDAAATKPFGYMRFNPGPGLGGHCLPIDPFYLAWKAREAGIPTRFIELTGEVNVRMPEYVVEKLMTALNRRGKPVKGTRVLVLGLAYKPNIDDPRESPAFEIIDLLLQLGAEVSYHDPHIPVAPRMRSWPQLPPLTSVELTPEVLASTEAAIIVTDHRAVDYEAVADAVPLVVDTRGVLRGRNTNVVKA